MSKKASVNDLVTLNGNFMEKLNELMKQFESMFADKESTRKKIAAFEKAVSNLYLIFSLNNFMRF